MLLRAAGSHDARPSGDANWPWGAATADQSDLLRRHYVQSLPPRRRSPASLPPRTILAHPERFSSSESNSSGRARSAERQMVRNDQERRQRDRSAERERLRLVVRYERSARGADVGARGDAGRIVRLTISPVRTPLTAVPGRGIGGVRPFAPTADHAVSARCRHNLAEPTAADSLKSVLRSCACTRRANAQPWLDRPKDQLRGRTNRRTHRVGDAEMEDIVAAAGVAGMCGVVSPGFRHQTGRDGRNSARSPRRFRPLPCRRPYGVSILRVCVSWSMLPPQVRPDRSPPECDCSSRDVAWQVRPDFGRRWALAGRSGQRETARRTLADAGNGRRAVMSLRRQMLGSERPWAAAHQRLPCPAVVAD
jgi:hypothetical protein